MNVRCFVPVMALALAACSAAPASNTLQADVNSAAAEAQGDIDTYAANTLADRAPDPSPAVTPVAATSAGSPAATTRPDDAAAAVAVARRYFTLIEAGDYSGAYRLWEDDGTASGMSERAFADSFARFDRYRAQVGAAGSVQAGAGQRYTDVPVRVSGTLADGGRPFVLAGALTLHRTVVDGASAEQQAWRIRDSSLRPRPDQAAAAPADAPRDACVGGTRVSVSDDARDGAPVWQRGDRGRVARDGRDDASPVDPASLACDRDR